MKFIKYGELCTLETPFERVQMNSKNVLNKKRIDITLDDKYSIHEVISILIYLFTKEYYISSIVNNNMFTFLKISDLFDKKELVQLSFEYNLNHEYSLLIIQNFSLHNKKRITINMYTTIGLNPRNQHVSNINSKFIFEYSYDCLKSVNIDNKIIDNLNCNEIGIKEKANKDLIKLQNNIIKKIIFYDKNKRTIKKIFETIVNTFTCYEHNLKIKFDNVYKLNNILQYSQKNYNREDILSLIDCFDKMKNDIKYNINNIVIVKSHCQFKITFLAFKMHLYLYTIKDLLNLYDFARLLLNIIENGGGIEKLKSMIIRQRLLQE